MAIRTTGDIKLRGTKAANDGIQAEFKGAATNVRISNYFRGGALVPAATAGVVSSHNSAGTQIVASPAGAGKNQKFSYYYGTANIDPNVKVTPAVAPVAGRTIYQASGISSGGSMLMNTQGQYGSFSLHLPDAMQKLVVAGAGGKASLPGGLRYDRRSKSWILPLSWTAGGNGNDPSKTISATPGSAFSFGGIKVPALAGHSLRIQGTLVVNHNFVMQRLKIDTLITWAPGTGVQTSVDNANQPAQSRALSGGGSPGGYGFRVRGAGIGPITLTFT